VPNLIALTPDERRLYVALRPSWDDLSHFPQVLARNNGAIDVIDTGTLQDVKTIPLKGGIHDLLCHPGRQIRGRRAARDIEPPVNMMSVIDTGTNEVAWTLSTSPSPSQWRSTRIPTVLRSDTCSEWKSQWIRGRGFFATRREIKRVNNPENLSKKTEPLWTTSPSHGIASSDKNAFG